MKPSAAFFEKKQQKTFDSLWVAGVQPAPHKWSQKFFAALGVSMTERSEF
jgi:hypothetical protein